MVVQFNTFIPVIWIDVAAAIVVLIIVVGAVYKLRRWLKVVPSGLFRDAKKYIGASGLFGIFFSELGNRVLAQKKVLTDSRTRRAVHLMMFWGFLGLGFATVWDDVFYRNGVLPSPTSFSNLGNIIGNIAGAVLLIGMSVVVLRYAAVEKFKNSYKGDIGFLTFLYLATITGFATELSRFSSGPFADAIYLLHLGFIGALFVSAPFTHFFHALLTPIMRYVEAIHTKLMSKQVDSYPFYRRLQMADMAEEIRAGNAPATFPAWLESRIHKEKNTEQKSDTQNKQTVE
ncbi:MAG: hypothetical protein ACYCPP_07365 [Nitrososphaerales archaeon]